MDVAASIRLLPLKRSDDDDGEKNTFLGLSDRRTYTRGPAGDAGYCLKFTCQAIIISFTLPSIRFDFSFVSATLIMPQRQVIYFPSHSLTLTC